MNNVPLINNLTVNDINTALIAIKKNLVKGSNGNEQLQDVDVNVDVNIAQNSLYCAANSRVIKGAELFQGCSIKVLFTSAITGSNTTSPLTINYNNVDITVKVGKNGALADFVAYNTGSGYVYCQAYTTLELLFDGNNFVIMGNPVVISNSDYTVYTDGSITQHNRHLYKYSVSGTLTFEFVKPTEDYLINKYFLVNAVNALDGYDYPYYSLISIGEGDNNELYCKASNFVNNCVNNVSVRYDSNTNKVIVTVETGKTRTSVASLCDIAIY